MLYSKESAIKRKRILFITIVLSIIIIALIGTIFFVHSKSVKGTTTYENGDYIYCPEEEHLSVDENTQTVYFDNMLVIYTLADLSDHKMQKLADKVEGDIVGNISGIVNAFQLRVRESDFDTLNEKADLLMKSDDVLYAGYDYPIMLNASETDNNPWSQKKHFPDSDRGNETAPGGNDWWAEAIGAYTAWQYSDDCKSINVGVIDNGFDLDHEDLKGKDTPLPLENYSENTIDKDFKDHGTHIAGIIGAQNNEKGIRGVADNANLHCVDYTPTEEVNYLDALEYLEITKRMLEKNVRVINLSAGYHLCSEKGYAKNIYGEWFLSQKKIDAVKETGAYNEYLKFSENHSKRTGLECMIMMISALLNGKKDFIIVQAAGNGYDNSGPGVDARYSGYYAAIDENVYNILTEKNIKRLEKKGVNYKSIDDRILIVGAIKIDENGNYRMTDFSNYGHNVDITAPGENIFSTNIDDKYGSSGGTSDSAPMVAGSAALIWSLDSKLEAGEVKECLMKNAVTKAYGVGNDTGSEYPMLNVGAAVQFISERTDEDFFKKLPREFIFSAGVGAWETRLELNPDGTFSGEFHDSEMGDTGDQYPKGTVYICNFNGKFTQPQKIDKYTYLMKLDYLNVEGDIGSEYYKEDVRYVILDPYGLNNSEEFLVYFPGVKIKDLPEEVGSWIKNGTNNNVEESLSHYVIYNSGDEAVFVSYESKSKEGISKSELLEGYWENCIQSKKAYKFLENGTVKEYDLEPLAETKEENFRYSRTMNYSYENNRLVIFTDGSESIVMKPVTSNDSINWDQGIYERIAEVPKNQMFFYETDWSEENYPDNAMYMVKVDSVN